MRKLGLLITFFALTPCVLFASIILFAFHSFSLNPKTQFFVLPQTVTRSSMTYAALPTAETQFTGTVAATDSRVERVRYFFRMNGSILEQYAQEIVDAADKYGIDYRWIPALGMQESIGCKREIPNTHNCWGWGIYTNKTTSFDTYPQAIDTITKLFSKNYISKGLNTPEQVQQYYNPSNTSDWKNKITYFMNQL